MLENRNALIMRGVTSQGKYGKSELAEEINDKLEAYYTDYMTKIQPSARMQ